MSWLHSALPKPVLFGLYGAVGGLLGVLLLGELLWWLVRPTPAAVELKVAVASQAVVYPGSRNQVAVKIARQGFEGPVYLEATGNDRDLQIPGVEIPADKNETLLYIFAKEDAALAGQRVKITARAEKKDKKEKIDTTEIVFVKVEEPPPALQLSASPLVTVFAGYTNEFPVVIERQRFKGEVRIEVLSPPPGVEVKLNPAKHKKPALREDEKIGYMLVNVPDKKSPAIAAIPHRVEIEARALSGAKLTQTATFQLSVEPAPGKLDVQLSPKITVYEGDKNELTVLIGRRDFDNPVEIDVVDAPPGVQTKPLVIGKNMAQGKLAIHIDRGALAGKPDLTHKLRVVAKALGADEEIAQERALDLRVEPHPGKLTMTVSPEIVVFPGEENTFTVRVARTFNAPVQLVVEDKPAGLDIPDVTIAAGKSDAVVKVSAKSWDAGAQLDKVLTVRAMAKVDGEDIVTTRPIRVRVEPPPPTVQVGVSPEVSVYPGGKAQFKVTIRRNRFDEPVKIDASEDGSKIAGLVTLPSITIPKGQEEAEMVVSVDATVFFRAGSTQMELPWKLTATSTEPKVKPATAKFKLKVLLPPSALKLAVSDKVEVNQGGKCQFSVKVERGGFQGPVRVDFSGLPTGVAIPTLPPVILQANETSKIVDGRALIRTPEGPHKITATATATGKAPDGKVPTDKADFTLVVKKLDPSKRPPPLDVIFVLDVTDSMDPQIKGVRDGVQQFIQGLTANEMEARVGMVAFRDIEDDGLKALMPIKFKDGSLFTSDFGDFREEVGKLKADKGGDEPESSLDAIKLATEHPFSDKARRVLILITDAPYQTRGNATTMAKAQEALKAGKIDQIHLVVNAKNLKAYDSTKKKGGPGYDALHKASPGRFFDLTQATKGAGKGFADILPVLSDEIASTIVALEPAKPAAEPPKPPPPEPPPALKPAEAPKLKAEEASKPPSPGQAPKADQPKSAPAPEAPSQPMAGPVKSKPPEDPPPPEAAKVDPPAAEVPREIQGVASTEQFSEKDRLQLLIAFSLLTAAVAAGIGLTLVSGQKRYLGGMWPGLSEAGKAIAAGLVAGLLAGAFGQWFFQNTSGAAFWNTVSRLLAWAIVGGLFGAGMALFVPNLLWQRALLGGAIGGLIGGLGFVIISWLFGEVLGRWIGAIIVGFFIGLMIGFAEIAFRRYWLEIRFGEREIRTVTLGAATIALGGDEKLARVYVAGAPGKALGYRVERNRVLCEDFTSGKTAEVPVGDLRNLANARVKVCSLASAESTGVSLRLVVVRNLPLLEGMPLTSDDIPGLEAQGSDGIVALVSRRPNDPKTFLLRNRSKQPWTITEPGGATRKLEPGLGLELNAACNIDFGQVRGALDPSQIAGKSGETPGSKPGA